MTREPSTSTWVVTAHTKPLAYNQPLPSLVIEAASAEDAVRIAADQLRDLAERVQPAPYGDGYQWSGRRNVYGVRPYERPPAGTIIQETTCAACQGSGTVEVADGTDLRGAVVGTRTETCARCEGTGTIRMGGGR